MSRELFLARVRAAAAAGRNHRVRDIDEVDESAGYVGGGDDLPARLAAEVDRAGGRAHLVSDVNAGRETLCDLLAKHKPRAALCWRHPVLDQLQLRDLLAERRIELIHYERLLELNEVERRQAVLASDIGITGTTYAVAETGSLVLASAPGNERWASLLPPVHVAVVQSDQILPDLFDLFHRLRNVTVDSIPSNITLVTGPSKTGDLELRLTTGVHGPGEWHVIIIR